jgi:probable HAF family extracellular repeat protein
MASYYGFLWEPGYLDPILGYGSDSAKSINNHGSVAGTLSGGEYGYIHETDGTTTFLTPPQNWSFSALASINNIGHAAGTGYSNSVPGGRRGFLFDGSNILPIEPLAGDSETRAAAINDSDTITGVSTSDPNQPVGRGFIANGSDIVEIGFLPGTTNSYPAAINNQDSVVGISGGQAFLYANDVMQPLGYLPGDNHSVAHGINDNGDIVGRSGTRAFLYRGGEMIDLSALEAVQNAGWSSLYEARAINNVGQIVGQGDINGSYHAFILSPM